MQKPVIIFAVLFVIIWFMHKPFDVHNCGKHWLVKLHEFLEIGLIAQFFIILNEFLR